MQDCAPGNMASCWGMRTRSTVPGAALINGTLAHARELDD